jgi:hypothetical protein
MASPPSKATHPHPAQLTPTQHNSPPIQRDSPPTRRDSPPIQRTRWQSWMAIANPGVTHCQSRAATTNPGATHCQSGPTHCQPSRTRCQPGVTHRRSSAPTGNPGGPRQPGATHCQSSLAPADLAWPTSNLVCPAAAGPAHSLAIQAAIANSGATRCQSGPLPTQVHSLPTRRDSSPIQRARWQSRGLSPTGRGSLQSRGPSPTGRGSLPSSLANRRPGATHSQSIAAHCQLSRTRRHPCSARPPTQPGTQPRRRAFRPTDPPVRTSSLPLRRASSSNELHTRARA